MISYGFGVQENSSWNRSSRVVNDIRGPTSPTNLGRKLLLKSSLFSTGNKNFKKTYLLGDKHVCRRSYEEWNLAPKKFVHFQRMSSFY